MAAGIPIGELPEELDVSAAVEAAYGSELDWAVERLRRGASVMLECDKQLVQHLYVAIRGRFRAVDGAAKRTLRLIDGRRLDGPGGLIQKTVTDLSQAVQESDSSTILVLPHLDLLTTTTRSGLTMEAREAVVWFYDNPEVTFLGFKDMDFELPEVIEDLFPARRSLLGCPRAKLPRLVLQREARKLAVDVFNPFSLYKYVSGLNPLKLRKVMEQFHDHRDFDPANPQTADAIQREIRRMTVVGNMELPRVDLEKDVGGYGEVKTRLKKEILELVSRRDTLPDLESVRAMEEIIPKGIIFSGPPGTGKTFFAKALATAMDATLQVVSGPELKSKWVGESEANLRRVFTQARESAPAIIVFDELDSFATQRGTYTGSGVEHSMVNQLLTEMDGFHKEELVLVIGTTNFVESLDPALLRPGRFELQITIPYPGEADRRAILEVYRRKFKLDLPDPLLELLVRKTEGFVDRDRGVRFSGDHLYAICRGFKRDELRDGRKTLTEKDVLAAVERESDGPVIMNPEEERVVACHEAGHALVAALLPNTSFPEKIVITPDENAALGYVIQEVKKNRYITTRAELRDTLAVAMGGRAAEQVLVGEIGVGAWNDLKKATEVAAMMVETLGMSGLGNTVFSRTGPRGEAERRELAPETARELDREIASLVDEASARARELLERHRGTLEKVVTELLARKVIKGPEFRKILEEAGIGSDHHQAPVQ